KLPAIIVGIEGRQHVAIAAGAHVQLVALTGAELVGHLDDRNHERPGAGGTGRQVDRRLLNPGHAFDRQSLGSQPALPLEVVGKLSETERLHARSSAAPGPPRRNHRNMYGPNESW